MPREENNAREAQAKRHVSVMKAVFGTETAASIEGAQIIEAGYAPQPEVAEGAAPTVVTFATGDAVTAIFHAEKPVAVLDPASYRYVGGGYLRGWRGVEEDLIEEAMAALRERQAQEAAAKASEGGPADPAGSVEEE